MLGILFAVLALLSWGFGDFFIQKATRIFGDIKTLFYIGITGVVVLFPFIRGELTVVFQNNTYLILLTLTGVVIFFAALFDFEGLRCGKIAIIEPVLGIELPVTIALAMIFLNERPSLVQLLLMLATFLGIVLAITVHHTHLHYHKRIFEKGIILAGLGAITMGLVNFLVGVSSQKISPLMTIWFTNTLFTALCVVYMVFRGELKEIIASIRRSPKVFATVIALDNAAWIFYAFAASLIPISVATTISESYIALTVLLGIFVSREKLKYHQIVGIVMAILSVIILSAVSG